MLNRRSLLGGATAVLGAVAAPQVLAQPKPVRIRVGYTAPPLAQMAPLFMTKPEILKHHDKSYTFEGTLLRSGPLQVTAFAANEIQVGNLNFNTFYQAVVNAGMADMKVIGDECEDGRGRFDSQIRVRKDSGIDSITDLKGKVIATLGIGSGLDFHTRFILRKHGLEYNRDYTYLETPFPTMKAMLLNKKADAAYFAQPFASEPDVLEQTKLLFAPGTELGPLMTNFICARGSFIANNRAVLVDYMEDFLRVVRWYYDPANRDESIKIVAEASKVPEAVLRRYIFTQDGDYWRSMEAVPDLDALQRNLGFIKELGLSRQDINVKDHADLSIAAEAAARLKSS